MSQPTPLYRRSGIATQCPRRWGLLIHTAALFSIRYWTQTTGLEPRLREGELHQAIVKRKGSSACSVAKASVAPKRWRSTSGSTQGRNPSAVPSVPCASPRLVAWRDTRGSTQGRNPLAALSVRRGSHASTSLRSTRRSTQERDHLPVRTAERGSQRGAASGYTSRKTIPLYNIGSNHSTQYLFRFQRLIFLGRILHPDMV